MVSALGLGCLGMSEFYGAVDEKAATKVIHEAYESGITFFDTADMYGDGENEKLLGSAIKTFRDKIVIATKCGLQPLPDGLRVNNTSAYIKKACDNSLRRLALRRSTSIFYTGTILKWLLKMLWSPCWN